MLAFFTVMALPILACLLLVLIHPALGQHVLARGVIFVDLALAQIAALGGSVAILLGHEAHDPATYLFSFGFTLLGAALFSFLWDRNHSVLQEAFIGISFAVATATTLVLLANSPHGAEHVQGILSGEALGWVTRQDIIIMAVVYAAVGLFLYTRHRTLFLCSSDPHEAARRGHSLRWWDFSFYASFGIVVTDSVKVAGVLAVFSFLIVPMVCSTLLGHHGRRRLLWAWGIGFVVCLAGSVLSYLKDWPMGATIVGLFGLMVAIISVSVRMKRLAPSDLQAAPPSSGPPAEEVRGM